MSSKVRQGSVVTLVAEMLAARFLGIGAVFALECDDGHVGCSSLFDAPGVELFLDPPVQLGHVHAGQHDGLVGPQRLRFLQIDMLDLVLAPCPCSSGSVRGCTCRSEPGTSISWPHISGTSSQPSWRAAVAGKDEPDVGRVVKIALATSSVDAVEVDHQRQQFARRPQDLLAIIARHSGGPAYSSAYDTHANTPVL